MKINNAKVCLDCEELFEFDNRSCPKCGSFNYWYLSAWINTNRTLGVFEAVREEIRRENV